MVAVKAASASVAFYLTADVLRELMPLFAVVRAKRRPLVITCLSALQGLCIFLPIRDSNSAEGWFFFELRPNRNEFKPVYWTAPAAPFQAPPFPGKCRRGPKFRRRSAAANHDLAAAEKP
jgi:hypothetical protein